MAGIETFLAGISLEPGCKWTDVIFDRLDKAEWVFFLASKSSIHSPAVQQELGASLMQKKIIIPLLIDITPEELPGWIGNHQAINLKGNQDDLRKTVAQIAEKIKVDKFWAGVIATVFVIGLVAFLSKSK
jgi:hypothetical protein